MSEIVNLPNQRLEGSGTFAARMCACGCRDFHDACRWLRELPYGPNSGAGDASVLFGDGCGTCITKHGVAAHLARELDLEVHRYEGLYQLDASILPACGHVLDRKGWPYIPQIHCFLQSGSVRVDLTEGNCHGKTRLPEAYDVVVRVPPDQTHEERRTLYVWALAHLRTLDPFWSDKADAEILDVLEACTASPVTCPNP